MIVVVLVSVIITGGLHVKPIYGVGVDLVMEAMLPKNVCVLLINTFLEDLVVIVT